MGISILSVWQTCQASNVGDCEFPGVCALFTGSCCPTFCGAVGTLPDIRRSLEQWQSHRYDRSDWSLEKGEDIKGVCHTYTPLHASFVFIEIFVYPRKVSWACSSPQARCKGKFPVNNTCWWVSDSFYNRRDIITTVPPNPIPPFLSLRHKEHTYKNKLFSFNYASHEKTLMCIHSVEKWHNDCVCGGSANGNLTLLDYHTLQYFSTFLETLNKSLVS